MERRPTHQVYNEIITCRAIFLNLEESRSHGSERKAKRGRVQGAHPTPLGARPASVANQARSRGSYVGVVLRYYLPGNVSYWPGRVVVRDGDSFVDSYIVHPPSV